MVESRETESSLDIFPKEHWRSSRWLILAVVGTVVGVLLLAAAFLDASKMPDQDPIESPESITMHEGDIVIAVARTPGGPTEWANWAQVIQYLSENLNQPVIVRYLSEEDEAAGVIATEHIDLAFVCAQQYLDLRESGDARGLCTPVMQGSTTSRSLLIVKEDSEFESFEDLKQLRIAVSDKSSLGGVAFMQYLADEHEVTAETYFSEIHFGDTMEANLSDLRNGSVDVTVVNDVQTNIEGLGFRVIEASPFFGNPPLIATKHVTQELSDRVVAILTDFDAEGELPSDSAIDGFVPLNADDYAFANILRVSCDDHAHP